MKSKPHDPLRTELGEISLSDIVDRFRGTKIADIPILHFDELHRRALDEQHTPYSSIPSIAGVSL